MRSTLSNPIETGVDSFVKVSSLFNQLENSKKQREIMDQEIADKEVNRTRDTEIFARQKKKWAEEDEQKHGQENLNFLESALSKAQTAKDKGEPFDVSNLTEQEQNSMIYFHDHMGSINAADYGNVLSIIKNAAPQVQGKKAQVPFDDRVSKTVATALQLSDDRLNVDDYGNRLQGKIKSAVVDGTSPSIEMGLVVERKIPPTQPGKPYKHIGDNQPVYVAPDSNPQNVVEKGNINLSNRPVVKLPDGKIATVFSMSIGFDGKEVLIPCVSQDGRMLNRDEAVAEWRKTITKEKPFGEHLGVFNDIQSADAYAQELHNSELWKKDNEYYGQDTNNDLLKHTSGDPNAPYTIFPAQLAASKFSLQKDLADMVEQLEAKLGGAAFSERKAKIREIRKSNAVVKDALKAVQEAGEGTPINELRSIFMQKLPLDMPIKEQVELAKIFIPEKEKKSEEMYKTVNGIDMISKDGGETWGPRWSPKERELTENGTKGIKEKMKTFDDLFIQTYGDKLPTETDLEGNKKAPDKNTILSKLGTSEVKNKFDKNGKPITLQQLHDAMQEYYEGQIKAGVSPAEALNKTKAFGQDFGNTGKKGAFDIKGIPEDKVKNISNKSNNAIKLGARILQNPETGEIRAKYPNGDTEVIWKK
ncbi:MAG: hypothetical protein PHV90_00295 [Smithella sp.]|nr:hypothetical protein [Smithella sp.]